MNSEPSAIAASAEDETFARERFLMRARALFFARAALLGIGLCTLLVPAWRTTFQVDSLGTISVYLLMVAYSAANYVLLERGRLGAVLTYITLCLDLGALLYLIVAGSIVGFTAYVWLIHHESPTKVGTYAYVNPVVAVLVGYFLGGESLGLRTVLGTLLVLVSVLVITTARLGKAAPEQRAVAASTAR